MRRCTRSQENRDQQNPPQQEVRRNVPVTRQRAYGVQQHTHSCVRMRYIYIYMRQLGRGSRWGPASTLIIVVQA